MRKLLTVERPKEAFRLPRSRRTGRRTHELILDAIEPEAACFAAQEGLRCGVFVIDVVTPSDVPSFAKIFLLDLDAHGRFPVVMGPPDHPRVRLEELGKRRE